MRADDPRHGSRTGYKAGCREECCRRPHRVALKLYRMGRAPQIIDATGTRRRIEGMFALGWTAQEIANAAGRTSRGWAHEVRKEARVVETTAQAIRAAAELLHYQPDGKYRPRQRRIAERAGYKMPAAWLDIDDPDEQPDPGYVAHRTSDELDENVVTRVLAGEWRMHTTPAEKAEIARRWVARGGSIARLAGLTGWKVERYFQLGEDGAA